MDGRSKEGHHLEMSDLFIPWKSTIALAAYKSHTHPKKTNPTQGLQYYYH